MTLNRITDKAYADYVCNLTGDLFHIKAGRIYRESVVVIQISRKILVKYLLKIGLKKGNKLKQHLDIPRWIKKEHRYVMACVRGLIDTDGSLYLHKYTSNGKIYYYRKISFSSRSKYLIKSVKEIFESITLHPKIDCRGDIRLYNTNEVKTYFSIIGSHNPKHIKKFIYAYGEGASRHGRGLLNLARD